MKNYTTYKKIQRPYFNFSELLGFPVLPLFLIAVVSYFILLFFGLVMMLAATVGIAAVLTIIYHGLKNASPNGSNNPSYFSFMNFIWDVLPSFLVILGVLLITNIGAYIVVTFQRTGVFYATYFYVWLFVVLELPILYFVAIELNYQFRLHYQAYYFTPLSLSIVRDYELFTSSEEILFLQTKNKMLTRVVIGLHEGYENIGKMDRLSVLERNDVLYKSAFSETIYIPKDTNRLKISWYSALEDTYYEDEIDFPFHVLQYVENKYPLDVSKFLRGKKTDRVMLSIQQGGMVQLYNKHQNLLGPIAVKSVQIGEEKKVQLKQSLSSIYSIKDLSATINTVRNAVDKREMLRTYECSWQVAGKGLEGHNVEIKDVVHNYTTSAPIKLHTFELRRLPIFFEIDYHKNVWLFIHIDAEKLYSLLQENSDATLQLTFDFTIDLENGKAELLLKNNERVLPFTAWENKLDTYRWKEAKDTLIKNKEYDIKNNFLKEIYEFIVAKDYAGAEELCEKALEQYTYFPMIYFYKARLLWYVKGYDASYEKQEYFIEKTKTDPYALAQIYNNYGCLYDEQKRYAESLVCFEKAYTTYPKQVFYLANLAEIHYKMKDAKMALQYAQECIGKEFTSDIIAEIIKNKGVLIH